GALAGGLVTGWLLMALVFAPAGVRLLRPEKGAALSNVSLIVAHLFLVVGAVWLLLSRLGIGPQNFSPLTVLLAPLHFPFSGFALQIVMAATGRQLEESGSRLSALHRYFAIGAVA